MSTTTVERPATGPQVNLLKELIDERDLMKDPRFFDAIQAMDKGEYAAHLERLKKQMEGISFARARHLINHMLSLPKKHESQRVERGSVPKIKSDVPAGHYAVTGEDGTTDFYRVDRPTEGRWAGYIFVKLQLSDNYERVPLRNIQTILDKIEADGPESASKRYGKELGRCGVCNRTLTNNDSIERGIGPVCAAKYSWSF
jgi:hypothetical protein